MVGLVILIVAFMVLIAWRWSVGIDDMQQNHKEYKGEDFLDEK